MADPTMKSSINVSNKGIIQVNNIYKSFADVDVLKGLTFTINEKEILGLIGPSGGGKSTLLRCLNLLEAINHGCITYFDRFNISANVGDHEELKDALGNEKWLSEKEVNTIRKEIGLVFQGFNLWEERTVLANLTLAPLIVLKQQRPFVEQRAFELCQQFGLENKLNSTVWRLSGGQRQRVAIMRALMMNPKILLLDEVTSALDPVLTYEVMQMIRWLRAKGLTMVIVTHHIEFATSLCDRLMYLADGQIVQLDTPINVRNNPATEQVKRFLEILQATR